jgi:glycosyltransferase involved in cell wall biosynthesis
MKVSVCLLSYNRTRYLGDTLDSLKYSPGADYELIINDDGSDLKEKNRLIISGLIESGQASTAIFNKAGHNEGVGRSINKCFAIASGDLFIKLDSDLNFVDNWLKKTITIFEENPRLGLLGLCHYKHDPVDMRKTVVNNYDDHDEHTHILGSAFAVRREVYEKFGLSSYSPAFSEDWELMNKIHDDNYYYNGLPIKPLAENFGMGLGKSTIALNDSSGNIVTKKIHSGPFIVSKDASDKVY